MDDPISDGVQALDNKVKGMHGLIKYPLYFVAISLASVFGTLLIRRIVDFTPFDLDDEFLESIYDDFE